MNYFVEGNVVEYFVSKTEDIDDLDIARGTITVSTINKNKSGVEISDGQHAISFPNIDYSYDAEENLYEGIDKGIYYLFKISA